MSENAKTDEDICHSGDFHAGAVRGQAVTRMSAFVRQE
jgi:hypothetical protein